MTEAWLNAEIKWAKSDDRAVAPSRRFDAELAFDLYSVCWTGLWRGPHLIPHVAEYHTFISFDIPKGYAGFLLPRFGSYYYDMLLTNCVGVKYPGDTHEVTFIYRQVGDTKFMDGDMIGHILFLPMPNVTLTQVDRLPLNPL